jgi:hypothetical protein
MKIFFSTLLTVVIFANTPVTNAALYQGIITGTTTITSDSGNTAPFSDGDPFTLTILVDTTYFTMPAPSATQTGYGGGAPGIQVLLDIGGYTGTFGASGISISNNDSGFDGFGLVTNLEDPNNIFNGLPSSHLGFQFYGPTTVLQSTWLEQSFNFTDFNPGNISFDANTGQYIANLTMTSGNYAAVVPIPSAMYLFTPALAGLVALARRKKKEEIKNK